MIYFFTGKTCEDVRRHRDVRIARKDVKAKKLIARPQYKQHVIYDENMIAIQLKKTVVKLNKPRYIGMCILDLSKLVMYRFHYEFIMPKYPGAKLLFTDTDSFCYWIPSKTDVYADFKGNQDWFDFSNYEIDHPNFDYDVNNLVPGKMKDEMAGIPIQKYHCLHSMTRNGLQELGMILFHIVLETVVFQMWCSCVKISNL